jgi:adenylate cyclase
MSAKTMGAPQSIGELRLWQRFHVRVSALFAGAFLVVLGILGGALYDFGMEGELRGLQQRLRAVASLLAAELSPPDLEALGAEGEAAAPVRRRFLDRAASVCAGDADVSSIYVLLKTERDGWLRFGADFDVVRPSVRSGELYDARALPVMLRGLEEVAVEDRTYEDRFGVTLSGYAPLRAADRRSVGLIGMDVDAGRVAALRTRVLRSVAAFFALAAALLLPLSALVARSVRGPIEHLIRASAAIADGRFETRIALVRRDEFGLMAYHFDFMAEGLEERERIRATFGRYLAKDVARALLSDPGAARLGGEEREVAVLISDLQSYSTVSEHLPPQQVVEVLNTYVAAMTEEIEAEHGVYLEFLGDGFLAVFGAPNDLADKEARAVRCALAMQRRLSQLNAGWEASGVARLWQERGIARLAARIGVHRGVVVAGNVGSRNQMRYTVVGDVVNVAARLQALNKELGTDVLASSDVIERLPKELAGGAAPQGEHRVKGRDQVVRVYSL